MNAYSGIPVIESFAKCGYASFSPSLRGHTNSVVQNRPGFANVTIDDYVKDIEEVITAIRHRYSSIRDDPVLIGHSAGGIYTMKYSQRRHVKALILLASEPPKRLVPEYDPQENLEELRKKLGEGVYRWRTERELKIFFGAGKYRPGFFILASVESYASTLERYENPPDLTEDDIPTDVIVIIARNDAIIKKQIGILLANRLNKDYLLVPGGHMLMFEESWNKKTFPAIIQWLNVQNDE